MEGQVFPSLSYLLCAYYVDACFAHNFNIFTRKGFRSYTPTHGSRQKRLFMCHFVGEMKVFGGQSAHTRNLKCFPAHFINFQDNVRKGGIFVFLIRAVFLCE